MRINLHTGEGETQLLTFKEVDVGYIEHIIKTVYQPLNI